MEKAGVRMGEEAGAGASPAALASCVPACLIPLGSPSQKSVNDFFKAGFRAFGFLLFPEGMGGGRSKNGKSQDQGTCQDSATKF